MADLPLPGSPTRFDDGSLDASVVVDPATHRLYFPLHEVNGRPVLRIMESSARR